MSPLWNAIFFLWNPYEMQSWNSIPWSQKILTHFLLRTPLHFGLNITFPTTTSEVTRFFTQVLQSPEEILLKNFKLLSLLKFLKFSRGLFWEICSCGDLLPVWSGFHPFMPSLNFFQQLNLFCLFFWGTPKLIIVLKELFTQNQKTRK